MLYSEKPCTVRWAWGSSLFLKAYKPTSLQGWSVMRPYPNSGPPPPHARCMQEAQSWTPALVSSCPLLHICGCFYPGARLGRHATQAAIPFSRSSSTRTNGFSSKQGGSSAEMSRYGVPSSQRSSLETWSLISRFTHERWGDTDDPSKMGKLRHPTNINKPLREAAKKKLIRTCGLCEQSLHQLSARRLQHLGCGSTTNLLLMRKVDGHVQWTKS